MNLKNLFLGILCTVSCSISSFAQDEKQEVLKVVHDFFHTMETKDSVGFNNLFLENAQAYSVRAQGDSTLIRNSTLKASTSKNILKERLREEKITIHIKDMVAAVWAPYEFWVNDEHSHCGYEVFTLIKKDTAWKIASLTYSVNKQDCKK